jgi:hypothetical protein
MFRVIEEPAVLFETAGFLLCRAIFASPCRAGLFWGIFRACLVLPDRMPQDAEASTTPGPLQVRNDRPKVKPGLRVPPGASLVARPAPVY